MRAVVEQMALDHSVAATVHDALWAALWNRRHDDVDVPLWLPDSAYHGMLAFAHALDDATAVAGVDTNDAFIVFRVQGAVPPVGSRVRVAPADRELWRFGDVHALGLGCDLRFDAQTPGTDTAWIGALRAAVHRLQALFDARRESLAARRAQLGALQEPSSVEDIWREEVGAIGDRAALETEFTPKEHAALARARAKGPRGGEEEERRITAARKQRYSERVAAEVAAFREERWPALRDRGAAEKQRYLDYRTEVVRLEDALQRIRALGDRARKARGTLDALEDAGFRVAALALDDARLEEAAYAEEVLRTIELLGAAIPARAPSSATSFSAYRAPTAGPSVIPPRY